MIRPIRAQDLLYLATWPHPVSQPPSGWIVENPFGIPVFYATLTTPVQGPAFIDNFVASPYIGEEEREIVSKAMLEYLVEQARIQGYAEVVVQEDPLNAQLGSKRSTR